MKEKDWKVVKEFDKFKELKKEKDWLFVENEKLRKNVKGLNKEFEKMNGDNFVKIFKELENVNYCIFELLSFKEVVESKNREIDF